MGGYRCSGFSACFPASLETVSKVEDKDQEEEQCQDGQIEALDDLQQQRP